MAFIPKCVKLLWPTFLIWKLRVDVKIFKDAPELISLRTLDFIWGAIYVLVIEFGP